MSEIKSTNKYLIKRKYKTIGSTTYPMDEYQVILIEEDSEDCGFIRPQYQWSGTTGYICDFETYTKYSREVKMVSYDSGETWSIKQPVEERKGSVIAYDSYDCGKPMYRCVETNETYCEDNGDDFAASFYRNNEETPRVTIECSNSVIDGQDENYFGNVDWYSKIATSSITQVNIGECVVEFKKFYWSFDNAILTVGNNVRTINNIAISSRKFPKYSNFACPIVLPRATKKIQETDSSCNCYIKPLANPNVDEFVITNSPDTVKGEYNIVAPYGTKYGWEQLKIFENISGGSVVQEHYETPNDNWKAKITFTKINGQAEPSVGTERTFYLADDPTHVLRENELHNISNLLVGGTTLNTKGTYKWNYHKGFFYYYEDRIYDIYAIKEIDINSSVSAITSGAVSAFTCYSTDYPFNIKLNEGLLVVGDMINLGGGYYNYQIDFPSSLTAITTNRICPAKQTETSTQITYGYTLKFTSVIPPTLSSNSALDNAVKILVPCSSLNRYLTEWSRYADIIEPISYECLHDEWKNEGSFACVNDKLCTVQRLYRCLNSDVCYPTEETRTFETSGNCNGYEIIDKMVVSSGNNETYTLFYSDETSDIDDYRIQFGFNGYEEINDGSGGIMLMKDLNNEYCKVTTSLESQTKHYKARIYFQLAYNGRYYTQKYSDWNITNNEFELGTIYIENLINGEINGNKDDTSYVLNISNRNFVAYIRHAPWKWLKVYKRKNGEWKLQKYLLPCMNKVTSDYYFFNVTEFVDDNYSE